jgi:phosphoglycolate phosphatase-like HAD superfamily hydrolase
MFDFDGTLINSFAGSKMSRFLKELFFSKMRRFYLLAEIFEAVFRRRIFLHIGALHFLLSLKREGYKVGIVTDRSLFSFVIAAKRCGLPLSKIDFVHARRSMLDFLVRSRLQEHLVFLTNNFKGHPLALKKLEEYFSAQNIQKKDVVMVGDDGRDRLAAAYLGVYFVMVNRYTPDFSETMRLIKQV